MTIKLHHKLLLTGDAGGLGKALRDRLKANCTVLRLSDVLAFGDALENEEIIVADLADAAAVDAMVSRLVVPYPRRAARRRSPTPSPARDRY